MAGWCWAQDTCYRMGHVTAPHPTFPTWSSGKGIMRGENYTKIPNRGRTQTLELDHAGPCHGPDGVTQLPHIQNGDDNAHLPGFCKD